MLSAIVCKAAWPATLELYCDSPRISGSGLRLLPTVAPYTSWRASARSWRPCGRRGGIGMAVATAAVGHGVRHAEQWRRTGWALTSSLTRAASIFQIRGLGVARSVDVRGTSRA
jgi:hypothetical protein